jgi:Asp/Glu/hydantoin racemase
MPRHTILWQSSTVLSRFPDYENAIHQHAEKILGPDIRIITRGVERGTPDLHFQIFDFLNNVQVFQSVARSLAEGADAVSIGCFLDPILDELREVMEIPVMGLAEAGMLTACTLGKKFSIISYLPQLNNKRYGELVHKYGMKERCAGLTSFYLPFEELDNGFRDPDQVIKRFTEAAGKAVDMGAEVLLPGCGCLNLILMQNRIHQIQGATVLDVTGTLLKMTEMMMILKKVCGIGVSRNGLYESPPPESLSSIISNYLNAK